MDRGVGAESLGRQRIFNQTTMDQLLAAASECKQPGRFPFTLATICQCGIYSMFVCRMSPTIILSKLIKFFAM